MYKCCLFTIQCHQSNLPPTKQSQSTEYSSPINLSPLHNQTKTIINIISLHIFIKQNMGAITSQALEPRYVLPWHGAHYTAYFTQGPQERKKKQYSIRGIIKTPVLSEGPHFLPGPTWNLTISGLTSSFLQGRNGGEGVSWQCNGALTRAMTLDSGSVKYYTSESMKHAL